MLSPQLPHNATGPLFSTSSISAYYRRKITEFQLSINAAISCLRYIYFFSFFPLNIAQITYMPSLPQKLHFMQLISKYFAITAYRHFSARSQHHTGDDDAKSVYSILLPGLFD